MKKRPTQYTSASLVRIVLRIKRASSEAWQKHQRAVEHALVRDAKKQVPAYSHYAHTTQTTAGDPVTSKKKYVCTYPRTDLLWQGKITTPAVFTATSGSTGEPTYFMRSRNVDEQASIIHELFYTHACNPKEPTLVIVCFGMGIWIGGLITYNAFRLTAERGHPISIITPGVNIKETLRALRELAPMYKQVIMCGYPPFIKDILDTATHEGVNVKKLNLRLLFAAEAFSDRFREYMGRLIGTEHLYRDITNIYGTADIGAMAFETPLAGMVRHLTSKNKKLFTALFGSIARTPTLAQYIPDFCSFTEREGQLYTYGDSAMPLINYELGDRGGVFTFDELCTRAHAVGIDIRAQAKKARILDTVSELPFVYVYERTDFVVTLYGLNVFPEPIRETLLMRSFAKSYTGKCTLETVYDAKNQQKLFVHIECKEGVEPPTPSVAHFLSLQIAKNLREKNAEYNELYNHLGERALPVLQFWPHGSERYFRSDIKQKWVIKNTI